MRTLIRVTVIAACLLLLLLPGSCLGYPEGAEPVKGFEIERYLGKWYEIARLDHSFERGLDKGTAEYSLRADGGVDVLNRGYRGADETWQEARGRAYFVREKDEAYLQVSFFWPFYGSYVVYDMDLEGYQWAAVCSSNASYLWLLAREPRVSQELMDRFLRRAEELGFATKDLIFVDHD